MDENTYVDVFEETKENYPKSFKYVKAQVNALDENRNHILIKGIQSWIKQNT